MRKSTSLLSVIVAIAISMVGCGPTTRIENSWVDPTLTPSTIKPFDKVLYIAQLSNDANRRIAEDRLVASSNGRGVASYSFFTPGDTSEASMTQQLMNGGFDGVVELKLTDVEKETNYTSSSYGGWYGGYYGGYGYGAPMHTTGSTYTTKTFYVQTNVFSLKDNKLLYAGTTSSVDPSKVDKTVDQIVAAVRADLKAKGFIK
jgi:hypothetical protein